MNVLLIGLLWLGGAYSASAQSENNPYTQETAEDIIDKYLEAIGGKARLDSLKTLIVKGKMDAKERGMVLPATYFIKHPDKSRFEVDFMNQKLIFATDGTSTWVLNPLEGNGQARELPGTNSSEASKRNNPFFTIYKNLLNYQKTNCKAELAGKISFRGKRAYKIRLKTDEEDEEYYLDAHTYYVLMAKIGYQKNYFDNYKKVGDFVFPHSFQSENNNSKLEVDEVSFNTEVADSLFKMPFTQLNGDEDLMLSKQIADETFDFSDENLTAAQIMLRFDKATGKQKDINSTQNFEIAGKMTIGSVEMPFRAYLKADKFRLETAVMNQKMITATNGKIAWEQNGFEGKSEPQLIESGQMNSKGEMFAFGREVLDYQQKGLQIEYLGKTKVRSRVSHVIRVKATENIEPPTHPKEKQKKKKKTKKETTEETAIYKASEIPSEAYYFFDAETSYLLLKYNKSSREWEYYSNYKHFENTLIPSTIEHIQGYRSKNIKLYMEALWQNTKINDKIFDFPGK